MPSGAKQAGGGARRSAMTDVRDRGELPLYRLVFAAWLPPWLGHTLDPDIGDSFVQIFSGVVVVPLVLSWGYVWKHYVLAPADRWR